MAELRLPGFSRSSSASRRGPRRRGPSAVYPPRPRGAGLFRTLRPMLKPSVQVGVENGVFVAEFWDCLRLDPVPVQELRAEFDEHLRKGGRADLVIDLLGVGFAGSAALGGFVALQRVARGKGGGMGFAQAGPA